MTDYKRPLSVLVVIHTPSLNILLLERAQHPSYWQSVTGSIETGESLLATAQREVAEETGIAAELGAFCDWQQINRYDIFPEWRHRYAPGVTQNTEHVFSLQVSEAFAQGENVRIAPNEHTHYQWLFWQGAAPLCFSASNREAILALPQRLNHNKES